MCPTVERAEKACVSDVFSSQNLCHKQLFFSSSQPSYSSSKSPSRLFILLFRNSNLLFVLWFCRQCSSILFLAPLPSSTAYCSPPHAHSTPVCMADQTEISVCRAPQTQSRHQKRNRENDNDMLSSVLSRVPVHYETSLADHHVPRGQPAKQPADTGDHSLTHCCFVSLMPPFRKPWVRFSVYSPKNVNSRVS